MRSGQAPAFGSGKAYSVLRGLAVHAEEVTQNEDAFSVWECCRLARRVAGDHPDQFEVFNGDFTADYSERFTKFGSQDWEHLQEGWMLGRHVLVFNSPLPDGQTPEGWHSYHLAGRNLSHVDRLLKAVPEKDYVGTVLSPHVLIRASYQSRQFQNHFDWNGDWRYVLMSGSNPILYPRAAMDQWLGSGASKSSYTLDEFRKLIEPT